MSPLQQAYFDKLPVFDPGWPPPLHDCWFRCAVMIKGMEEPRDMTAADIGLFPEEHIGYSDVGSLLQVQYGERAALTSFGASEDNGHPAQGALASNSGGFSNADAATRA